MRIWRLLTGKLTVKDVKVELEDLRTILSEIDAHHKNMATMARQRAVHHMDISELETQEANHQSGMAGETRALSDRIKLMLGNEVQTSRRNHAEVDEEGTH